MTTVPPIPHFLAGAGETAALINSCDWSASPLGHPSLWAPELLTVVRLMLGSTFPMFVAWGPQLGFLYNDAYASILGIKHPHAFGAPFAQVWSEIWPDISPIVDDALAGKSSYFDDLPLIMERQGYPEATWFTFSYSPVQDTSGAVNGMFCTCVETTNRVLGERRQAFQLSLADRLRSLRSPDEVTEAATELLGRQLGAARCFYADVGSATGVLTIRQDWIGGALASLSGAALSMSSFGHAIMGALLTGHSVAVDDIDADERTAGYQHVYRALGVRSFIAVPVLKEETLIAILSVHGALPRRWSATERALAHETVERTWAAVEQAHADQQRRQVEIERERLLRELGTINERMAEVFRQAPAFMCVLHGPEHVFELINERYTQLVGRRNLIGKSVREALPEVASQGYMELLDNVYQTGRPFVGMDMAIRLQREPDSAPEDRFIDLSYIALLDIDGHITGILAHGIDQTERHLATLALRTSEERYRTLFDSMDQGFCVLEMVYDASGAVTDYRYVETNPLFTAHTGLSGVLGKLASEVVGQLDPAWYERFGVVAQTGIAMRFESEAIGRWFDVYANRIGDHGSSKVALLFRDISARKASDAQLRRLAADLAEADRRKTEFLATLAHELRNPLAPIRSGLSVMRMSGANPATMEKIRAMMDRQVSHMVRLIDDLLDIARIGGGKLELIQERALLADVVASAIETSMPLIETWRHQLHVALPTEPVQLHVDATRIAQVVANLLNNAAKYTPPGGRIALGARVAGDTVVITVQDNGMGIPPESLASVFEMFNQVGRHRDRAQGGLGIGLSLVRQLVQMHGGSVEAASGGPGQGSIFTVTLPLGARQAAAPAAALAAPQQGARRIMVVDDNVDAAEVLAAMLELDGHQVCVAHSGTEALRAAAEFHPDVAFLDIGMPGMNGYEVAEALRRLPAMEHLRLVALTGWGAQDDRDRSRDAGFNHHLTKPADFAAVQQLLA